MATTLVWSEREHRLVEVTLFWSGAMRGAYLSPLDDTPAERRHRANAPPPAPRSTEMQVDETWLAGGHYRAGDAPRTRLHYSVQLAGAPFTVAELAEAARVSRTAARRYVDGQLAAGKVRRLETRVRTRTRVFVFEVVRT